jgi:hypothetical protein
MYYSIATPLFSICNVIIIIVEAKKVERNGSFAVWQRKKGKYFLEV